VTLLALDTKKLDTCIADAATIAMKTANENEQQKLTNARGTPGFFIVNTKTGKSTIVSGAYPVDEFISKIDTLLM
jgi:protein-disulfide isomerase